MQIGLTLPRRGVLCGVMTPEEMFQVAEIADRSEAIGFVDPCVDHLRVSETPGFHEVTRRMAGWHSSGRFRRGVG